MLNVVMTPLIYSEQILMTLTVLVLNVRTLSWRLPRGVVKAHLGAKHVADVLVGDDPVRRP